MSIIEVSQLTKSYDNMVVVDGVSFAVEEGEIFAILGPNGAGKTTTVESIAGLRTPDSGRIEVFGFDPLRDSKQVRELLGVQLQESRFQDRVKVREVVETFAAFKRDPVDVSELLERLGLSEKAGTRYSKLSGGQQQRLSIAVALVGRPRAVILDELTTGLDPQARRDTCGAAGRPVGVARSWRPPVALGGDRERGILRRLSTTPAHPRTLVLAHLAVQLAVVALATAAAVVVGTLAFSIQLPQRPGWFIVSFALGACSLLALGLWIGSMAPTASTGQGIGMLVYFPLLFFAGVYIPIEVMPDGIRTISSYTPAGAAVRALSDSWTGSAPQPSSLLVMLVYAVVPGALAVRFFRWQ